MVVSQVTGNVPTTGAKPKTSLTSTERSPARLRWLSTMPPLAAPASGITTSSSPSRRATQTSAGTYLAASSAGRWR